MSIEQAVARLAGGFLQPIPRAALEEAIQAALAETELGPLAPIQSLPGMTRAATTTLMRAWDANLQLHAGDARRAALARLEEAALSRLRPSMCRPADLTYRACANIRHAPRVLGKVEVANLPDIAPVWQPFLSSLAEHVEVTWRPGARQVPDWLTVTPIKVVEPERHDVAPKGVSCANPRHEAIEALRWARELIARGQARPQDIAITAASPSEWDGHLQALSRDANLPIHFAHGRPVVSRPEGQLCAALAEALLNGLTQDRVRRLVPLLRSQCGLLQDLPGAWTNVLPRDAPLTSAELWRRHLKRTDDWPDGVDFSDALLAVTDQIARGPEHAREVGEALLRGVSLSIWRQALTEGPPHALDVTLQGLRLPDEVDPATAIVWGPAATIAGAPRSHLRLIGLTSRAWPRPQGEDPLLPEHIVPQRELDPVPVPERDQRDFHALLAAAASEVVLSQTRRDAEGRQLGASPLWPTGLEPSYLERARVAPHVMSESDRLLARPQDFKDSILANSTRQCWIDWHTADVTAHDGLIQREHPLIVETLARPQSTGALKKLLRDPLGYVWQEVLKWREPDEDEEPLILDNLAFGNLVHAVLEDATRRLEAGPGIANAGEARTADAAHQAVHHVAAVWEEDNPVPPRLIWRRQLDQAKTAVAQAFAAEFGEGGPGALNGQSSLAEVPFGQTGWARSPDTGPCPPWDAHAPVTVPGTELRITGRIDRLDLASDQSAAAVVDYKTGKAPSDRSPPEVRGGRELQRCLYAFAVRSLLGEIPVDARLVYPFAQKALTLADPDATLTTLAGYLDLARRQLRAGNALPGEGTEDTYNDFSFALPGDAKERYFRDKRGFFNARHGDLVDAWSLS